MLILLMKAVLVTAVLSACKFAIYGESDIVKKDFPKTFVLSIILLLAISIIKNMLVATIVFVLLAIVAEIAMRGISKNKEEK